MNANHRFRAPLLAVVVSVLAAAPAIVAGGRQTPAELVAADAQRFAAKRQAIEAYGARRPSAPFQADRERRTVVSEAEVNAYLRLFPSELPAGMTEPYLTGHGEGRVSFRAVLELDPVRRSASKGGSDFSQLLMGRWPVSLSGVLKTKAGLATFDLGSASIAGIPIPKALLQLVVSHYTRSVEHPDGIGLDSQVALPAGIREIVIQSGQAVIVQ